MEYKTKLIFRILIPGEPDVGIQAGDETVTIEGCTEWDEDDIELWREMLTEMYDCDSSCVLTKEEEEKQIEYWKQESKKLKKLENNN